MHARSEEQLLLRSSLLVLSKANCIQRHVARNSRGLVGISAPGSIVARCLAAGSMHYRGVPIVQRKIAVNFYLSVSLQ
jgi:hypothetical protein